MNEGDALNQIFIKLKPDNTFEISSRGKVEKGRWKTNTLREYTTIYFYYSNLDYYLTGNANGEAIVNGMSHNVIGDIIWYSTPKNGLIFQNNHAYFFEKIGSPVSVEDEKYFKH